MFYQLGLKQFGAYGKIKLEPAPHIQDLLKIALEAEVKLSDLEKDRVYEVRQ